MLSICLFVCLSVAEMQKKTYFLKNLAILSYGLFFIYVLLTTYRKSYVGFSKNPLRDP